MSKNVLCQFETIRISNLFHCVCDSGRDTFTTFLWCNCQNRSIQFICYLLPVLSVLCGSFLEILDIFDLHKKISMDSSGEKSHRICGTLFFNEKSNAFVYRCNQCECKFATGCGLEVHFLYEHTNKANDTAKNMDTNLAEADGDSIEMDANELDVIAITNVTKRKKRNRNSNAVASESKIFYCDICPDESFRRLKSVRQHMKCHAEKKLPTHCEICGAASISYELHVKEVHPIKQPRIFECDYCDARFTTNDARLTHTRKHTNEPQPYQCDKCPRSFRRPIELRQHTNSMHTNRRPYVCVLCDKRFASRQYLRSHQQSHGEKVFECKYCAKKFKTSATKRWHERKIHEIGNCLRLQIQFNGE